MFHESSTCEAPVRFLLNSSLKIPRYVHIDVVGFRISWFLSALIQNCSMFSCNYPIRGGHTGLQKDLPLNCEGKQHLNLRQQKRGPPKSHSPSCMKHTSDWSTHSCITTQSKARIKYCKTHLRYALFISAGCKRQMKKPQSNAYHFVYRAASNR